MSTPVTVPQDLFVPYLIDAVFYDHEVTLVELVRHLADKDIEGINIGEVKELPETEQTGPGLLFGVNGQYLMRVIIMNAPLTKEQRPAIHPILTKPVIDKLDSVKGQVLVSIHPNEGTPTREDRFNQAVYHAKLAGRLAEMEGAVGIHNVQSSTTVAPQIFNDSLAKEIWPVAIAPVWLSPEKDGSFTGYTYGLHQAGHPELQSRNFTGDPTELYLNLMNLANYVLSGAALKDGDTFSFAKDAAPFTLNGTTWVINEQVPALNVKF